MIDDNQRLRHALDNFDLIKQRIAEKDIAFFLDYDGTLTPIVGKPQLAILSQDMRECLLQISKHHYVAIISGRELSDVCQLVGVDTIYYAGNHGLEVAGPNGYETRNEISSEFFNLIDSVYHELQALLGKIEGVLIENKKFSLSVHYRLVDSDHINQIKNTVDNVVAKHPTLAKHLGKKVFEIRPKIAWHKGKVVYYLLKQLNLSLENIVPIYLGDDVTDEDAFKELHDDGISILVSEEMRQTAADFYLLNPDEVMLFLKTFIK